MSRRTLEGGGESNNYSWNLIHVHQPVSVDMIRNINSTKGLIIGGGGLFLPDTNKNSISGWQWTCPKNLLKEISVSIIIYTVGYNYFRGQRPSDLFIDNLNALIEKASFVGLRNMGSVESVKSFMRDDLKDKIVFQPCTTTIIRKIIPNLPPKLPSKKIAVNVAFDRFNLRFGENMDKILLQTAEAIHEIQKSGYEIYCVSHCAADLNFCRWLNAKKVSYKIVDGTFWLPDMCMAFYNEMDLVLGMRGHAQMIPFGLNTKIISLGTHDKLRWFLEDIDSLDWYVELNENYDVIAEKILDKFNEIQSDKNVNERLIESQNKLFAITEKNMAFIKTILQNYSAGENDYENFF